MLYWCYNISLEANIVEFETQFTPEVFILHIGRVTTKGNVSIRLFNIHSIINVNSISFKLVASIIHSKDHFYAIVNNNLYNDNKKVIPVEGWENIGKYKRNVIMLFYTRVRIPEYIT